MKENLSFYFESPEFKETLEKYMAMEQNNSQVYFDADQFTDIAEYYAKHGDLKKSYQAINYGLKIHPGNTNLILHKVRCIILAGNYNKAWKILDHIEDQSDREVKFLKAELHLEENNLKAAKKILNEIYEEENDTECILDIFNIYLDNCQEHEALKWINSAYKNNPEDVKITQTLAEFYYSNDNLKQAIKYFNKVLDKEPYNADCWCKLGQCYITINNIEEALNALDYCLAIEQDNVQAMTTKGECLIELNNYEEGCKLLSKAEGLIKDGSQIRLLLIDCYMRMKKYPEAIAMCQKHRLAKDTDDFNKAQVASFEALAYAYINRFDEALEVIKYGIEADANFSNLYIAKGEIYLLQNMIIEAQKEFSYAEYMAFDKQNLLFTLVLACMRCGFDSMALKYFKRLEKEYPDACENIYYLIAHCYYKEGNKEEMIKYIRKGYEESEFTLDIIKAMPKFSGDEQFIMLLEEIIKNLESNPSL